MPTLGGIFVVLAGTYCFLKWQSGLLGMLILAAVFQASSVLNIAGRGIQPFHALEVLIILRGAISHAQGNRAGRPMPRGFWLAAFGIVGILSALALPFLFQGIAVYRPEIGIDDGLLIRPPLVPSLNNAAQAGFLALHIATAWSIRLLPISRRTVRRAYVASFYVVVFFLFAQIVSQQLGLPYPDSYIRNTPGYPLAAITNGARNPSTFAEQSFAGSFLAMQCVGFVAEYLAGKGGAGRVLLSLAATGLVTSSSSLVVLGLFIPALLATYSPYRYPWSIRLSKLKRWIAVLLLLLIPLIALTAILPDYRVLLFELTFAKGDSSSFIDRTAADLYALRLLVDTYGLGVGLGSNRASSLFASLLSTVGIAGVFSFGMFYLGLFANLPRQYAWLRWSAFALLATMCFGIPDVTFPILWMLVLLAIAFTMNAPSKRTRPIT